MGDSQRSGLDTTENDLESSSPASFSLDAGGGEISGL